MIIGVCGFSWSGSSAVIDFLNEFDDNQIYNETEFILAFFPDGLQDLDYHLNSKYTKLDSSVAIERFVKVSKHLLNRSTNGKIKKLTKDYIDKLCQVRWIGGEQGEYVLCNPFFYNHTYRIFRKIRSILPAKMSKKYKVYPLHEIKLSIKPENFMTYTREYTSKILESIGLDLSKNIVLDQPFAGNNPIPAMSYYANSRAIVVDRDPRDLYLLAKKFFPKKSWQVPYDNVNDFIEYYYQTHKNIIEYASSPNILYLKFEDLIYEYEKTSQKIMDFLELKTRNEAKKRFIPFESMANTRLFERCTDYGKDIEMIEEKLRPFLYNFSNYSIENNNGKIFDEKPIIKIGK